MGRKKQVCCISSDIGVLLSARASMSISCLRTVPILNTNTRTKTRTQTVHVNINPNTNANIKC